MVSILSRLKSRLHSAWRGWVKWPAPLWRLRGYGEFDVAGERLRFVDIAQQPHDWWAWEAHAGRHEPEVSDFIVKHLRPDSTFFDVGAYIGQFTLLSARVMGPNGVVVAFEPDPVAQALLLRNLTINAYDAEVTVVSAGITNHGGSIHIQSDQYGNAVSRLSSRGLIEVMAVGLDDYCRGSKLWPDVVKVDIEGGELFALGDAARETVQRAQAIVVEIHEKEIRELGGSVDELMRQWAAQGKRVVPLGERSVGNYNIGLVADGAATA